MLKMLCMTLMEKNCVMKGKQLPLLSPMAAVYNLIECRETSGSWAYIYGMPVVLVWLINVKFLYTMIPSLSHLQLTSYVEAILRK